MIGADGKDCFKSLMTTCQFVLNQSGYIAETKREMQIRCLAGIARIARYHAFNTGGTAALRYGEKIRAAVRLWTLTGLHRNRSKQQAHL